MKIWFLKHHRQVKPALDQLLTAFEDSVFMLDAYDVNIANSGESSRELTSIHVARSG